MSNHDNNEHKDKFRFLRKQLTWEEMRLVAGGKGDGPDGSAAEGGGGGGEGSGGGGGGGE